MTRSRIRLFLFVGILSFGTGSGLTADLARASGPCYEIAIEAFSYAGIINGDLQIRWYVETIGKEDEPPPVVEIMIDGKAIKPVETQGFKTLPNTIKYPSGSVHFGERWVDSRPYETSIDLFVSAKENPACSSSVHVDVPPIRRLTPTDTSILSNSEVTLAEKCDGEKAEAQDTPGKKVSAFFKREIEGDEFDAIRNDLWFTKGELFREYLVEMTGGWSPGDFPVGPIEKWRIDGKYLTILSQEYEKNGDLMGDSDFQGVECLMMIRLAGSVAKCGQSEALDRMIDVGREVCEDYPVSTKALNSILLVANGVVARDGYDWLVPIQ